MAYCNLIERLIVERVVTDLLAAGYLISINDDTHANGEDVIVDSTDHDAVLKVMFSTDGDCIMVDRNPQKGREAPSWNGYVSLIYGNGGDVICDWTTSLDAIIEPILKAFEGVDADGNGAWELGGKLAKAERDAAIGRRIIEGFATAWDRHIADEEDMNGGDMVEWYAEEREKAKAFLAGSFIAAPQPDPSQPLRDALQAILAEFDHPDHAGLDRLDPLAVQIENARALLPKAPGPLTIFDIAIAKGAKPTKTDYARDIDGAINGAEFERLGLPIFGGCTCGAQLAAYNMYPSKHGTTRCADDIGDDGFATIAEWDEWCAKREAAATPDSL